MMMQLINGILKQKIKHEEDKKHDSDLAIQICLTFRLLYRQALRQTEGFINSLLKLMDLDLI